MKFVDATISVDSLKQLDDASIELLEKDGERTIASYGCTGAEVVIA